MIRHFFLFFVAATFLVASCAREGGNDGDRVALTLQFSDPAASRVDALLSGDVAGVFARIDGIGNYTQANHRFVSDASGVLVGDPAVYFSEAKQATQLLVYLPYVAGQNDATKVGYTTPLDQTIEADFRRADLLWGRTASTPMNSAVPVGFEHLLAKVSVSTTSSQAIERWSVHNVLTQGALNVETGVLTLGTTQSNIAATGRNELILPAQSIQTLDFTVGGVDYTFQPAAPIVLEAGKSHALNLTLNAQNHTVALSAPVAIADWTLGSSSATPQQTVQNSFTLHWLVPDAAFASTTAIELEAGGVGYRATNVQLLGGDNLAASFTFDFAHSALYYECSVGAVSFYNGSSLIQRCAATDLVGKLLYQRGAYTIGVHQSNLLDVTLGATPLAKWIDQVLNGSIAGGVVNQFVVQLIEPANANYKLANRLEMRIDGVVYDFSITLDARSNTLLGLVDAFSFMDESSKQTPLGYPFRIEALAFYQDNNLLLDFSCALDITRGGLITIQTFVGDVVGITTQPLQGWSGSNLGGAVETPFSSNPVSLVFYDALGLAKSATRVDLTIGGKVVSLTGFVMGGYGVAARSTNTVDINSGTGGKPPSYPYTITDVKVYAGSTLLNSGATATSIAVGGEGDLVIKIAK